MAVKIDEIIRSRRKTVQLTITRDSRLIVRAPLRLPLKWINDFVERKSDWIKKNLIKVAAHEMNIRKRQFVEGENIYFLGETYRLSIRNDETRIKIRDNMLLFPSDFMDSPQEHLEKWYALQARDYIGKRLAQLSKALNITFKSFRITSARRRWGSCSSRNTVNFTWRLLQAEADVIDYVIVHELCHVLVKNHSNLFWQVVEKSVPNYKALRKWLREHQWLMDL